MTTTYRLEEQLIEPHAALPEHALWNGVIQRAVVDARDGGFYATDARAWLLESPDFLLVAFYAGSSDPETLRALIRRGLDEHRAKRVTPRRDARLTLLTAPPHMPLWDIADRAARAVARSTQRPAT